MTNKKKTLKNNPTELFFSPNIYIVIKMFPHISQQNFSYLLVIRSSCAFGTSMVQKKTFLFLISMAQKTNFFIFPASFAINK